MPYHHNQALLRLRATERRFKGLICRMSAVNKLLGERYQFIQVLGTNEAGQTFLVADVHYPGHPKCVIQKLRLPTRNPMTLKFILSLLNKKVEVLEVIGQHRQIPSTFTAFEMEQNFYLVQEFIPGRSLQDTLAPGKPVPETAVIALIKEALQPLGFAQEHGVIHGKLKPSKMIRHQSDNRLVLLDFGLIKNISQNISRKNLPQLAQQTPPNHRIYLAPEQLHKQAQFGSDYYALGVIAIQALTGLPAEEMPHADHPNRHQDMLALLQGVKDLNPYTASVLARMIHPDLDRRYAKAADILADLERLQSPTDSPAPETLTEPLPVPKDVDLPEPTSRRRRQVLPWLPVGIGVVLLAILTGSIALRLPQRFLAAQRIRQADAAMQAQNPETAIARYSQALELKPDNPAALANRSQLHFDTGNAEAALADITQAIELAPEVPAYRYTRGNLRFAVGDVQGAIEDYTVAIEQDPNYVKAYINRGSARADWGDDRGAVEDYTQALSLQPDTETEAAAYLNRCLSHSNLGDQVSALEDCSMAINLRPSHSLAYQNRGLVRRRLGDFQGSLQDYNIAIQIDPDRPDPYYNRALTRQAMNDLVGALDDFSKAIAIAPDYVFAFYDRGLLHAELENWSQALDDMRQASQLCLDLGRTGCYEDAQYQINQIQADQSAAPSAPSAANEETAGSISD